MRRVTYLKEVFFKKISEMKRLNIMFYFVLFISLLTNTKVYSSNESGNYYLLDDDFEEIHLEGRFALCYFSRSVADSIKAFKSLFSIRIEVPANQRLHLKIEKENGYPVYLRKINSNRLTSLVINTHNWEEGNYRIIFTELSSNESIKGRFTVK